MRRTLVLALALAVVAPTMVAPSASAQRIPRKWLVAGIGALISGSVASLYAIQFENDIGGCSSVSCVVPVTVAAGAFLGFLIGNEMDRLYSLRYAHAPPMSLRGVELPLSVLPKDIALGARTIFVTGEEGVELVRAGPRLERLGLRARGLRGIGPVTADSTRNSIFVGTGVGLYRFPLRGDAPGALAHPGEISALSADGELTAIGLGPDFQIVRVADTIVPLADPIEELGRVVGLEWQGEELLWVLTEDRLVAYRIAPDGTGEEEGEFVLPTIGRRLAIEGPMAVVAAGSGGVYAVDISDPAAPTQVANWSGARFAYDATIVGSFVYVAAGPEGLYLTRLEEGRLIAVGLAREAGFVAAVEADDDSIYLLDRTGGRLRRIAARTER